MNQVMALFTKPPVQMLKPGAGHSMVEGLSSQANKSQVFSELLSQMKEVIEAEVPGQSLTPEILQQFVDQMKSGLKDMKLTSGKELEEFVSYLETLIPELAGMNVEAAATQLLVHIRDYPFQEENVNKEVLALAEQLIPLLSTSDIQEKGHPGLEASGESIQLSVLSSSHTLQSHPSQKQLHKLWQSFQHVTEQIFPGNNSAHMPQITQQQAAKVKELLQEMAKMLKQQPAAGKSQLEAMLNSGSKLEKQFFSAMFQSFQKRAQVPSGYQQQAHVKTADVVRWIENFTQKHQKQNAVDYITNKGDVHNHTSAPMTRVEQYVIHVNQNQPQATKQQVLIQEFERLLGESRWLVNKQGATEMHIKLRPSHLGDMIVKMTQVNGEMAVRILVGSQAAKDMLEGNLTQLRHMFSPQQVIIEKQETLAAQQAFQEQARSNDQFEDERDRQHSDSEERRQNEEGDEEHSFHELLMSEKV